jgi:hypothetical protein
MKEKVDELKRRRFCTYCEIYYSLDEALPHENTNQHRRNATIQLGRGFREIQSAIGSRLKTFWITSENEEDKYVISLLDDIRDETIEKINEQLNINNSVKFNLVLICKFIKGEREEMEASIKTQNRRVLSVDNMQEILDEAYSKLMREKS